MNYHVFLDSFTVDIEHSGIFNLFPKISILENKSRYFGELKAAFKTGASKVPRPRPVLPSLLACVNCQLSSTPAVTTKRKGEEERNKTNFSSCNDRSPK